MIESVLTDLIGGSVIAIESELLQLVDGGLEENAQVEDEVSVAPPSASIAVAGKTQLTKSVVRGNMVQESSLRGAWASANAAIASVDGAGEVTGVAAGGPVNVSFSRDDKAAACAVTVTS